LRRIFAWFSLISLFLILVIVAENVPELCFVSHSIEFRVAVCALTIICMMIAASAWHVNRIFGFTKQYARTTAFDGRLDVLEKYLNEGLLEPDEILKDVKALEREYYMDFYREVVGDTFFVGNKLLDVLGRLGGKE
jgi:hypothetical protein